MTQNCLNCGKFVKCTYPNKRSEYKCNEWSNFGSHKIRMTEDHLYESQPSDEGNVFSFKEDKIYEKDELNLSKVLDEVLDSDLPVPKDLKVDDREIPLMPNFWAFCFDRQWGFIGIKPFARQMWIALKLFGEYCPHCSDKRVMKDIRNIPVNFPAKDFPDVVQLLDHGVCPKCKGTRGEFLKQKLLRPYSELAFCSGQRCVTKDTLVLTQDGLMEIGDYSKGRANGFTPFSLPVDTVKNGVQPTSDFYVSKPERTLRVTLNTGLRIEGTGDHPIHLWNGQFKTLNTLTENDYVSVHVNRQVFGNKIPTLEPLLQETDDIFDRVSNHKSIKTDIKRNLVLNVGLAKLLGFWVAEGRGNHISNTCPEVLEFCEQELIKVFNKHCLKKTSYGITFKGQRGQIFWSKLIGEDLYSGSSKKTIPLIIRQSSKEIICSFLQGLFEGDGYISKSGDCVEYYTISSRLAKHVSATLLNLGIVHKFKRYMSWASNGTKKQVSKPAFTLTIEGDYLEVFQKHIGFLSTRKTDRLNRGVARHNRKRKQLNPFYYDILPAPLKIRFREVIEQIRVELKAFRLPKEFITKNQRYKCGEKLGYETLLNWDDKKKRRVYYEGIIALRDGLPLTRRKVIRFAKKVEVFKDYLSNDVLNFIREARKLAEDKNTYYVKVSEIKECSAKATYDFTVPNGHCFWTNGILSHNSGKSLFTSFLVAYINHRCLKLQKPAELYTDVANATLTATFVSLTFQGAVELLWTPIVDAIGDSKWYEAYHALMKHYNQRYSEELFKQMDTYISYRHRKLMLYPSVPNKRTLRGRTRYISAIDEIGWFDASASAANKVTISADEVYKALDRSLLTARTASYALLKQGYFNLPTAYALNVSSPSDAQDKIMQLVNANRNSKTVLAVHTPTWEINPKIPRKHPELVNSFNVDPIGAERDYGANPPLTAAPFIGSESIVQKAFTNVKNKVEYEYVHKRSREGGKIFRAAKVKCYPMSNQPASVMAIDAGYSDNSFAIAVGHREDKNVVFSALLEIIPKKGENVLNHSVIVRFCVEEMIKAFNVKYLVADRWNSLFLLHKLDEDFNKGIEQLDKQGKTKKDVKLNLATEQYSLKYDDFLVFRSYLEGERIFFPKLEIPAEEILAPVTEGYPNNFDYKPSAHLLMQCLTVQDAKRTVAKGTGRTDDLFRAIVLASTYLLDSEIVLRHLNSVKRSSNAGLAAIAATSGFSGTHATTARGQGIAAITGAGSGGGSTFARG